MKKENKSMVLHNLPPNWSWVKLGDVCEIVMGQSPPSATYNTQQIGLPFFQGKAEFTELYPEVRKWCSQPNKIAEPLDILVSVRAPVGSTNIANQKCCIGRGLSAIRYPKCNKFIFYFFRLVEKDLDKLGTGTTFKAISSKTINEFPIPLPSLKEQKKIVAKIEELFSELDNGIKQLVAAKKQLKTYRQAVLSYAFSGRLLREGQKSKVKSQKEILKAAEPEVEYKANELPEGWKWVKLEEVTENYDGKRVPLSKIVRAKRKGEYRYYGATGVIDYLDDFLFEGKYLLVGEDGANLLSKSRELAFIVEGKFWVNNHAHVLKSKNGTSLQFLTYFINSLNLEQYVSGSAQPKLTQANLNRIPVPHPSINEQHKIVEEIESRFSVADKLEQTIDENLKKSETLRQSILKKAFEGRLV